MNASLQAVILLSIALPCACSDAEYTTTNVSTVSADGASIEVGGVRLEVAPDVRYESHSFSSTGQPSTFSATLDGHDYSLEGGRLRIGNVEYGAVESGATVRISRAEGVSVDGEARGGLPRDQFEGIDSGYDDSDR